MKTAIYTRVSTEDQVDEYGLDAQLFKCRAMATVKDWHDVIEFSDPGISGTKDESERPGLAALMAAIASGEVTSVIVSSIDRIGRTTRLILRMVDTWTESGVDLVSCKEALDTTTATGRFVLRMFASLAELDRDNIIERTTAGRDARGRIDGEKGGRLPMGYMRTADGIEINEYDAAVVCEILDLRTSGATLKEIADTMNSRAIPTTRGHNWYASSVREVILNTEAYRGGKRGESEVRWPVIWDK